MDNLYEPSKKFFVNCIAVLTLLACGFSFVSNNSKFLESAVKGPFPKIVYMVILSLSFLFLFLYSFSINRVIPREKKYKKLLSEKDKEMSFAEENRYNLEVEKTANKRTKANKRTIIFGLIAAALFLFVFISAECLYLASELAKPPIDRTVSDGNFRLFMDLFTWFAFFISVPGYVLIAPFAIRNRSFYPIFIKCEMVFCVISSVHFGYWYLGNFTNYPSVTDGLVALIGLSIFCLCYFALKTEKKKKTLKEFENAEINLYDF